MENGWIGSSLVDEMSYVAQQRSIATCASPQVLKTAEAIHNMNVAAQENVYPAILLTRLFDIAGETTPSIIANVTEVETHYPQAQFAELLKRATEKLEFSF